MKIIELRIYMPFSLEENKIGQEWIKTVHNQKGDILEIDKFFRIPYGNKEDSILIEQLPEYEDHEAQLKGTQANQAKTNLKLREHSDIKIEDMTKYGNYTRIKRMIESNLPWFVKKMMPKDATSALEKTWDMYPYTKTVTINDYFKKSCRMEIDTNTTSLLEEENIHNLTKDKLKKREIIAVDITKPFTSSNELDSTFWKSKKNLKTSLICCYKLITLDFKIFPIQSKVESSVANTLKESIIKDHRDIYCSIDKWSHLTWDDLRKADRNLIIENEILAKESE